MNLHTLIQELQAEQDQLPVHRNIRVDKVEVVLYDPATGTQTRIQYDRRVPLPEQGQARTEHEWTKQAFERLGRAHGYFHTPELNRLLQGETTRSVLEKALAEQGDQ